MGTRVSFLEGKSAGTRSSDIKEGSCKSLLSHIPFFVKGINTPFKFYGSISLSIQRHVTVFSVERCACLRNVYFCFV